MLPIPLIVRATFNATGAITFTGNTLGLSRSDTAGVPGTQDSIGAFTSTNAASQFGTYPVGTTSNYLNNSSAAVLVLPAGSSVLYAELIWAGSYINGNVNLSAAINNPVSFTTPAGTFSVSPDAATSNSVDLGSGAFAYVRSNNVTSLVQAGGAGTYATGGVVGTIVIPGDGTANHAGWTLGVIYQNPNLPFRNMSLRAGAVLVQAASGPVNTTLTGFATPITGALGGRALFSAQEGDANRTGDQALFGPTAATLVALSGPNNFAANFFASQINNDLGQLNTTGTFGSRNQTNGAPGTNIVGGRQGWDITNVDISARLVNNQSSAVLSLTTSGDAYVVNGNAIQVNINAPTISVSKSSNVTGPIVGDIVTYTVTVSNTGTANAASVVLTDALSPGATFVAGSVVVAGVARPTLNITTGVSLGSLALGTSVTTTYQARVTSLPSPQQLSNIANAAFTFQSVAGGPVITGVIPSSTYTIPVYSPVLTMTKSASSANATVGSLVTYAVSVSNTGNTGATTTFFDNIPAGTAYEAGTFRLNGAVVPGANPAAGVAIGTIAAGATATVTFQVRVNALTAQSQLVNQATANYTFQPPDLRTVSGSAASNTVTVPVALPNVAVVKSASLADVAVGETMTYTSVVTNNGTEAVTNAILSDAIPAGTTFVTGSVAVAGQSRPTAAPASGIAIGTIAAGAQVSVTFQVQVVSLPNPAQLSNQSSVSYSSGTFNGQSLSNTATTPVYQPIVTVAKSADRTNATVGDTILYTLNVSNTGNISAAQATLTDNIPAGSSFVPGSVTVGGAAQPSASPQTGIPLGAIATGATVTVTFQTLLGSLPSPPTLVDQGALSYTYQLPSGRSLAGAAISNTVAIGASAPNVTVSKSANLSNAAVGDPIVYTIVVANDGISPVTNVVLTDSVPAGAAFVPGSLTIGGVSSPSANPFAGVPLGTLNPGASATVVFQATVVSLPNSAQLANQATAGFTSGAFQGTSASPPFVTAVYQAALTLVKSASASQTIVGDSFTYFVTVTNTGNAAAQTTLTDPLPPYLAFQTNSVLIDDTPTPGVGPSTGIPLTVGPGQTVVVSFVVTINALPPTQRLDNQASASFTYALPDGRQIAGSAASNSLSVPVSAPNVTVVKSVAPATAIAGDTLTFGAVVANNGIATVNNIVFSDALPPNVSFVNGSVRVDGAARLSANPSAGISIGALAPGASATVTFEVIITMAIPSQITNQSTVSFTSGVFSGTSASNTTVTPVYQPQIALVKSASTSNATVGDTIIYTVNVTNSGNFGASVTVADTIPAGTTFSPNSVIVDGVPQPGASPSTPIPIGIVVPGQTVVVTFAVVVTSLPSPQQISNTASAVLTYVPPDGRTIIENVTSNTVTFPVSSPNVAVSKATPSVSVAIGDTIAYTVTVLNSGIAPVTSVLFTDAIPAGTAFVTGSVLVNGVPVPAASPSGGIQLGSLAPGGTATVAFSVTVVSVPSPAQIGNQATVSFTSGAFSAVTFSNLVLTPVFQPVISAAKSASTANATLGDTVTYTLAVSNAGNYPATTTLTDTLPAGTVFVPNSVIVDGFPIPGTDPGTGIALGPIEAGGTRTVTFSVVVDTLPSPQQLVNQGTAAYSFTLPDTRTLTGSVVSNVVTIPVSAPNIAVFKSTPTTTTSLGDTVTYTTVIANNGIAGVSNVIFTDPFPAGTAFVPGSLTVDGVPRPAANPATGVSIATIAPGTTATVAFDVIVTSLPSSQTLVNQSTVSFTSGAFSGVTFSNTVTTPVFIPILSAAKSASTANATVGDTVAYTIAISNTGNYPADITVTDNIPAGTSLVPNSVLVNGQPVAGADPSAGVLVPGVATSATVVFSVVIGTLPPGQLLSNQASATYVYTLPDGRTFGGSFVSNQLAVPVSSPNVGVAKIASAADVVVGDNLVYTVAIQNNGIETVNNVLLNDPTPAGSTFVAGTVVVDGVPRPAANPEAGISLGSIAPGASVIVSYTVNVISLPVPDSLSNRASVSFTSGAFSATTFSNTVVTPVYQPIIVMLKSADTTNATVGDTVLYSINITNTGNLAADLTLTDTIPAGTAFVPNSVLVNGVPQPGANPAGGIAVGLVAPGASVNVTVTLQVTVDALPSPQQLSNQASATYTYSPPDGRVLTGSAVSNTLVIPVSSPDVSVSKSTDAVDAIVGDVITYTIVVANNGIATVSNVVIVDPVPLGTVFVDGTVTVDGSPRPGANPNTGIAVGSIAAGAAVTVTFQVRVVTI
ncbi:DUF7507 domain-containing protein [Cohnella sp. JJ-181]|uniref:DUF7507 domain-containing protein n=1 Tax=Cohnella rhizoplanae TaxID=2974897 RepID=UPI0022FF5B1B|nr:hypothetical protein [Cohnella sp. JJ-181]CAI6033641.1 hypothetical protein COHCIP112018_00806 [Cohnella sp. JJ-181]